MRRARGTGAEGESGPSAHVLLPGYRVAHDVSSAFQWLISTDRKTSMHKYIPSAASSIIPRMRPAVASANEQGVNRAFRSCEHGAADLGTPGEQSTAVGIGERAGVVVCSEERGSSEAE